MDEQEQVGLGREGSDNGDGKTTDSVAVASVVMAVRMGARLCYGLRLGCPARQAGRQARPTPAAAEIQTVASFIPPPSLISISPLRSAPQNNRVWTACRPMGPDCSSLGDTVMRNELCSAEILSVFRSVRLRLQILKRDPSRPLN